MVPDRTLVLLVPLDHLGPHVIDDHLPGARAADCNGGNAPRLALHKDDNIQHKARIAIAETLGEGPAWMADETSAHVNELLLALGCLANAADRRRLLKHARSPDGLSERVQKRRNMIGQSRAVGAQSSVISK